MEVKKLKKNLGLTFLIFMGIILISFIIALILIISHNKTENYFGTVIGLTSFSIVMLILGTIQFFPSIYRNRKLSTSILMWIMGFLWVTFSILLIIGLLPDYYKDIPKIINSEYISYEGKLTYYHVSHGRSTNTAFTIDDNKFKVNGEYNSGVLVVGRKYRVEYLPNTKYVINLYRYGN